MTTSAYDMLRSVVPGPVAGSTTLPVSAIHRDPTQPRQNFDEASLADLAASIKQSGIIEPLIVTPDSERDGEWIILVGERRFRAAQKAGLEVVPVILRTELSESDRLILQLTENDQRKDLTLREKAEGYMRLRRLMPDKVVGDLAAMLGRKPAAFSNTILAAKVTEGPAFEALEEDLIKDADALRLFLSLADEDQRKLLTTARNAAVTLSRPMLQKFKEGKKKSAGATPPAAPAAPSRQQAETPEDTEADAHSVELSQQTGTASNHSAKSRSNPPAAPPPKSANEYLAALTWRHWQILFTHLGIPLPEDPDDAGYTLLEFLEARGTQS
jgi:ParB family transcriptional regulator, chromosome partitioning protein